MNNSIDILYHWSEAKNRESILQNGLQILSRDRGDEFNPEYICCGTTPMHAWKYVDLPKDDVDFDLYQIFLMNDYDISVIYKGNTTELEEVRIFHGVPSDRIRWVGRRDYLVGYRD